LEAFFLGCLALGSMLALVSLVFGDGFAGGWLDFLSIDAHHLFHPVVLAGGITVFGGAGILLRRYSDLPAAGIYAAAVAIAAVVGAGMYFVYVRPMKRSESSIGFSMAELAGKRAEVLVPIPPAGFGEVLVRAGAGRTNQIAASFDGVSLPAGAKVVVVDVKDDTLYVSRIDPKGDPANA